MIGVSVIVGVDTYVSAGSRVPWLPTVIPGTLLVDTIEAGCRYASLTVTCAPGSVVVTSWVISWVSFSGPIPRKDSAFRNTGLSEISMNTITPINAENEMKCPTLNPSPTTLSCRYGRHGVGCFCKISSRVCK